MSLNFNLKLPNHITTILSLNPFQHLKNMHIFLNLLRQLISFLISDAPVCKQIEISANHAERLETGDISHVTCSLYSNPAGNVTFYWMTRNSSTNHSWSSGRDSHAEVWREGDLIELLCWGENEIGMQKVPCRLKLPGGSFKQRVGNFDGVQ